MIEIILSFVLTSLPYSSIIQPSYHTKKTPKNFQKTLFCKKHQHHKYPHKQFHLHNIYQFPQARADIYGIDAYADKWDFLIEIQELRARVLRQRLEQIAENKKNYIHLK